MGDLNSGTIIGRLTRDAEIKHIGNSGTPMAHFAIACNERAKKGDAWVDEASFFDVNLWGKGAEALGPYLVKGKQVGIEYRLKQERWTDQGGQNRSRVVLVAYNVELLGGGQHAAGQDQGAPSGASSGDSDIPF